MQLEGRLVSNWSWGLMPCSASLWNRSIRGRFGHSGTPGTAEGAFYALMVTKYPGLGQFWRATALGKMQQILWGWDVPWGRSGRKDEHPEFHQGTARGEAKKGAEIADGWTQCASLPQHQVSEMHQFQTLPEVTLQRAQHWFLSVLLQHLSSSSKPCKQDKNMRKRGKQPAGTLCTDFYQLHGQNHNTNNNI